MSSALKMSEAAWIGLHAMVYLAEKKDELTPIRKIASYLRVSENHLSKVLQRLARAGLIESARGPGGGFSLAKPPNGITLGDIYETIDGPYENSDCLYKNKLCGRHSCIFGDLLISVNGQVRDHLSSTRLSDLIEHKAEGKKHA